MADRGLLLSHISLQGSRGFEIGALMSPFVSRPDADIVLVDRLSTEGLREKYRSDPNVRPEMIAPVDVVIGDGGLYSGLAPFVGAGFDYAIASHVIEHIPDLVTWLDDIARLLRLGGRLILVVPDKRFTFDYLRDLSTPAEAIDAFARRSLRPSPGQVFDFHFLAVEVDKSAAWAAPLNPGTLRRYCEPDVALDMALQSHREGTYVDSHCWVFTPASLIELLAQLAGLRLIQWRIVFASPTKRGEEDFGLVLERVPSPCEAGLAEGFREAAAQCR